MICYLGAKYLGKNGMPFDRKLAKAYLKKNKVYDIWKIEIEDWTTKLYLRCDVPHIGFNSVMFEGFGRKI